MSKKNTTKKSLDPNVVNAPLEASSDEVLSNEEEVVEEVKEATVEEKKEDEPTPVPVPVEPGPVIIEEEKKEEPAFEVKEEAPVEEKKEEEPVPVPVEPDSVIIEEVLYQKEAEVKENSDFAGKYVLAIYATPRKSVDDISDELNSNRRFVADNIIIDRVNNRVVLETSDNTDVLKKTQKKYLSAGVKTVIVKA